MLTFASLHARYCISIPYHRLVSHVYVHPLSASHLLSYHIVGLHYVPSAQYPQHRSQQHIIIMCETEHYELDVS